MPTNDFINGAKQKGITFRRQIMVRRAARDSVSWQGDKCSPPLPDEAQRHPNLVGFKRQADGQSNLAGHVMARTEETARERQRTDVRTGWGETGGVGGGKRDSLINSCSSSSPLTRHTIRNHVHLASAVRPSEWEYDPSPTSPTLKPEGGIQTRRAYDIKSVISNRINGVIPSTHHISLGQQNR